MSRRTARPAPRRTGRPEAARLGLRVLGLRVLGLRVLGLGGLRLRGLGLSGLRMSGLRMSGPVRRRGRPARGHGQRHEGAFLRLAQAGPDQVELVLVVERVQREEEAGHQAQPAVTGAVQARVFLHLGDPLAGPVDGHERRDDDDPADQDGQQRQRRLHGDLLVEVAGLTVDLVVPDQVVDAEGEDGPDQPDQPDVAGLARTPGHARRPVCPVLRTGPARPGCRARRVMASPRTSSVTRGTTMTSGDHFS